MDILNLAQELSSNAYPGRGIVLGRSEDNQHAVIGYFIMGRSENSRNRIFIAKNDGIETAAFDPSKLVDPSLIIYAPVRVLGASTIVTNGDQTDTIYNYLRKGKSFEQALRQRTFEPDAPNYTPRISGLVTKGGYKLSILKSAQGNPNAVQRSFFDYAQPLAGQGHLLHTYKQDGNPTPSFEGEPKAVALSGDIDSFTNLLWDNLNAENKVSLFTSFINIQTGQKQTRIRNKNQ